VGKGADLDEGLAAYPLNEVKQVHPDVENDAALRDVLAHDVRGPRPEARSREIAASRPSRPELTISRARPMAASRRSWWPMRRITPASRQAATISHACATVIANGFSHNTCFCPRVAASTAA